MYLWMAVDISGALDAVRRAAIRENAAIGLSEVAFSLPAHVSLKISFDLPAETWQAAEADIADILRETPPFSIEVKGLGRAPGCLWIAMKENETLRGLHEKMVDIALRYGAAPHIFDGDFRYHSTLFLGDDEEKLSRMEEKLRNIPLPQIIQGNAFLIGGSETGKPGDYRVFRRISGGSMESQKSQ